MSPTCIKAIWGWFPLLTMIPSEGEQWGRYNLPAYIICCTYNTHIYIYIYIILYIILYIIYIYIIILYYIISYIYILLYIYYNYILYIIYIPIHGFMIISFYGNINHVLSHTKTVFSNHIFTISPPKEKTTTLLVFSGLDLKKKLTSLFENVYTD